MALAGKGGKVTVGANTVAKVTSWSLDISADTLETTALGDTFKGVIVGLLDASGSLDCTYEVNTDTNGQTSLQTSFLAGTSITPKLYVNATNYYTGTAFITGMNVETPVDDKVSVSFDIQFSGAVTYA